MARMTDSFSFSQFRCKIFVKLYRHKKQSWHIFHLIHTFHSIEVESKRIKNKIRNNLYYLNRFYMCHKLMLIFVQVQVIMPIENIFWNRQKLKKQNNIFLLIFGDKNHWMHTTKRWHIYYSDTFNGKPLPCIR